MSDQPFHHRNTLPGDQFLAGCCGASTDRATFRSSQQRDTNRRANTMDANRVIAASTTIAAGDVVWGRPVVEGKTMPRRKGIVLGLFASDQDYLVVWWYGMGPASMETTTLMFTSELTKAGDIWGNFRGLKASKLARGCYHFSRAHSVGRSLESHARRMLSIGTK